MRNIWVIAQREYKHYFISPIAYTVALAIFIVLGVIFYASLLLSMQQQSAPDTRMVVGPLVTILLFSTPAITMRTLADEQKSGTLEILLTSPVRDWEVVLGKWLGGVLFLTTILLATWFYPIILNALVKPGIDQGVMMTGYLGLFLLVSAFLAIGVMASSFFSNQIAAFFVSFVILLTLWLIGYPAQAMTNSTIGDILRYLDITGHFYNSFYAGIIDLKDVVYLVSITVVALFLGSVSVETRRWR